MSDNKPSPTENPEADSFLGRLSVVVFYSVMAGALVAGLLSTRPDSITSESQRRFGDSIVLWAEFGWVFFLTIVYLAGRYSEVLVMCGKALGGSKPKIDRPMAFSDALGFWLLPLVVFILSSVCCWILWRIPDAIKWVGELSRS